MIDRLREMAIFAKVIDHGSFRGAARDLKLSPSVISHHISQLEENLGVALIYRTTRKLTLTPEGDRLLAATRRMLDAVQGELHELSAGADDPAGQLRIALPSVLSKSPLMDMIAGFLKTYPRVRISLDVSDERKQIISGGFDLAIRMGLQVKQSASTRKIFEVQRLLVASPAFLAAYPRVSMPSELEEWQWLDLAPLQNAPATFQKAGVEQVVYRRKAQLSCNDAQGLYRLARLGAGLALVPVFLAADDLRQGGIVHVLPDWSLETIKVFADWPPNAPRNGLIRLFVDELAASQFHFGC
jgi:DNA-binding transcriptional LysR family regulator